MLPLARDQHGNPFEVPSEAAYWRVRRHTGGRPSSVLGPDGEPLFIPIGSDRLDLSEHGCTGSLRLEAVDGDYHPVEASVAYVEVTASERPAQRNAAATEQSDLVRTSFDAMTRTMEAMQRAQVERERALAEKDRALTDAQIAMQRNHVELMISLLEHATGGKPKDPVAALEQHVKMQKVIERQAGPRNAGLLMPTSTTEDGKEAGGKNNWVAALLPWTPLATQMVAKMLGKSDKKAAEIGRNSAAIVNGVTALQNDDASGLESLQNGIIGSIASATQPDGANNPATAQPQPPSQESDFVLPRPRAIREVLADLDDGEADAFDEFLDTLDADGFNRVVTAAAQIPTVEERAQWARQLMTQNAPPVEAGAADAGVALPDVPPALYPVLAQLTPQERMVGAQILLKLDRASVDDFVSRLAAMPPDLALQKIRQAIAEAERRSASVAHRAVRAVMTEDSDGAVS